MASDIKTIRETSDYVIKAGIAKTKKRVSKLLLQGLLAGCFVGFGAIGYYKLVALTADPGIGAFLGSAMFPVGIVLILMIGAELFTSDSMMVMGAYSKKYKMRKVIKVLAIVWIANLFGSITMSALAAYSGIFNETMTYKIIHTAQVKTTLTFTQMLLSSILCNMIVCTGVWAAYAMRNSVAKIGVLWLVITVFALSGTEHIVANMFYISTAYMLGGDISLLGIGYNFLVVTIGNLIGGAIIVSGIKKLIVNRLNDSSKLIDK